MTRDQGAATGQPAVDWGRYQQCPVCAAKLGQPCRSLTGRASQGAVFSVETDRPHGGRKLRAGGGDRG